MRRDDRNLGPLLDRIEVSAYVGCDWHNVPLHLPHTFPAFEFRHASVGTSCISEVKSSSRLLLPIFFASA